MKKNVLKIALFAFGLCAATTMTSCHSGEDVDIITTQDLNRTIQVVTNDAASVVTVDGQTKTGNNLTFENLKATGKISITATNRMSKTIDYDFKEDGTFLFFDVVLESSGVSVPQATAEAAPAGTVNNHTGSTNATETGVTADIDFNGATNTNASATGDYSITVFDPAAGTTDAEDLAKGQAFEEKPLAIMCNPDNATFSNPIKVSLTIPGSSDLDFKIVADNGDEATYTQTGEVVTADIPHFSIWTILLNLSITNIVSQEETRYNQTVDAKAGSVRVQFPYGAEYEGNSVLVKNALKRLFGASMRNVSKNVTWNKSEGSAAVLVQQKVKTYTFASKGKTVATVKVYGKITTKVEINPAEETPTHGGGSN